MKKVYYILMALIVFGSSCKTSTNESDEVKDYDEKTEKIGAELKSSVPTLPSPSQIAANLQATGADFLATNINNTDNAAAYMEGSEEKIAVNMGIYFANLAYTTAYSEKEASEKLLYAVVEMAAKLGTERSVIAGLADKYKSHVEVSDSTKSYLNEMNTNAQENLRASGRHRLAAISYAGFYIEILHMQLGIINSYPKDFPEDLRQQLLVPIYHSILSQKEDIGKIKTYLGSNIEGVENTAYYNDLGKLEELYSQIDYAKILESQDLNHIETDPTIVSLAKTIRDMRARLVE